MRRPLLFSRTTILQDYRAFQRQGYGRESESVALAEPDLGLPADVLAHLGLFFESQLQRSADRGGRAVCPGTFDQSPSGMGVPGFGERALLASRTGGICCRMSPRQYLSARGVSKRLRSPIAATITLARVRGVPGRAAGGVRCVRSRHGPYAWQDDVLRRGGTEDCREPPEVGRAPCGPAPVTESVSAHRRL